ncbi:MAG: PEP-CTERM sorting domain-containing protein [Candidatus Accumulibacter necessarius]|jgi:hypothetical protein|uniref:PEP-CTERM sorting domain-containing protein n=1 Tax=Candidatus Accumulibacter necessarius TaxID=2954386 RepID=UPI002FC36EDC
MKLRSMVRPLALVSALFGCGLAQANLIQNGDFATNANGWTYNNQGVDGGYLPGEGNPLGSFWINHNGRNTPSGDPDPKLSQAIATSAGTQYDLTFDYSGRVITGGFGLAVDIDGIEVASYQILNSNWINATLSFVASGANTTIAFRSEINGTDYDARIDSVAVEVGGNEVPEPATLALMGLAFAGLSLRRGRRTAV